MWRPRTPAEGGAAILRGGCVSIAMLAAVTSAIEPAAAQDRLSLGRALRASDAVTLALNYRARYEHQSGRFRADFQGSDQILAQRLLLAVEHDFGGLYAGAEFQDSRQQRADTGTPLGSDDVNAVELLRGYVGYRTDDAVLPGDRLDVAAGRITIDLGSRRLTARNRFRNTINAFTGVHGRWTSPRGDAVQAFYTLPVARRPADAPSLLQNEVERDDETIHQRFWALHYTRPHGVGALTSEVYLLGLRETDRNDRQTRDRNLLTPGFRLFKTPSVGAFDYGIETALQVGRSALSSAPDAPRLDTLAHFHHFHFGYSLEDVWRTRVVLQYDFASGDRDPTDGDNGRFDTLFGARRFELGPTGIFGALARSNLNAPGARVELAPRARWRGFVGYRAAFLAARRDALTTAGVQDPTGASGKVIGHQFETRVRYDLAPTYVRLESGLAYLKDGSFLKTAPNTSPSGDSVYAYSQISLSF